MDKSLQDKIVEAVTCELKNDTPAVDVLKDFLEVSYDVSDELLYMVENGLGKEDVD